MESVRPRFISFAPISTIADRLSSSTGSFQPSAFSAVASLRAPCSGRCCSYSTPPTWMSLLPVGLSSHFYADDSRGGLRRQLQSSGVEWSLVLSGLSNECVATDCSLTFRLPSCFCDIGYQGGDYHLLDLVFGSKYCIVGFSIVC